MKILSLGFRGASDEVRSRLQRDCLALGQEGFRVAVDECGKGTHTFLGCNLAEGELSFRNYERAKSLLKDCVAEMLAEHILDREEQNLIRKIINRNYYYFSEQERGDIYNHALKLLDGEGAGDFDRPARRARLVTGLQEYLDAHHELVLDGFMAFRLKAYRERLAGIVDRAVDEHMMDKEYKEFIRVLRYFVDVQEAQINEVHIIFGAGDTFKLRDAGGGKIHNQYLEALMIRGEDINYEDLLISALITIAPQTVIMHFASAAGPASPVVETVQNVFAGRVTFCHGCKLCRGETVTPEFERN